MQYKLLKRIRLGEEVSGTLKSYSQPQIISQEINLLLPH